jgi:hypothetical protein
MHVITLGIILAGAVQAKTHVADEGSSTHNQSSSQTPLGFPVRIIEDGINAEAREASEREATQREKDDLSAQERMAEATDHINEATQSMKNAAWWSFGAVFLGTILLAYTLKLTRAATISAQTAVDVTRKIGNLQMMPHVFCETVEVHFEGMARIISINIKNCGLTPAKEVEVKFTVSLFDKNEVEITTEAQIDGIKKIGNLFPMQCITIKTARETWTAATTAKKADIDVTVTYRDPNTNEGSQHSFLFTGDPRRSEYVQRG